MADSMKGEYETNPIWAEATNDDKAKQEWENVLQKPVDLLEIDKCGCDIE